MKINTEMWIDNKDFARDKSEVLSNVRIIIHSNKKKESSNANTQRRQWELYKNQ